MRKHWKWAVLSLSIFVNLGLEATQVVSSGADSGPGTLRAAIVAINSGSPDNISINNGLTITLT